MWNMQEFGFQFELTMTGTNSDYNIQNKIALYLELRMRGEIMLTVKTFPLNGETSDTNDNVKNQDQPQSTWNPTMTWHTWWTRECARSVSLLSPCSVPAVTLIPCTHRMAQDVRVFVSTHPCMKWVFPLTSFFITFIFLLSFLINLKQFLLPFNFSEDKK